MKRNGFQDHWRCLSLRPLFSAEGPSVAAHTFPHFESRNSVKRPGGRRSRERRPSGPTLTCRIPLKEPPRRLPSRAKINRESKEERGATGPATALIHSFSFPGFIARKQGGRKLLPPVCLSSSPHRFLSPTTCLLSSLSLCPSLPHRVSILIRTTSGSVPTRTGVRRQRDWEMHSGQLSGSPLRAPCLFCAVHRRSFSVPTLTIPRSSFPSRHRGRNSLACIRRRGV